MPAALLSLLGLWLAGVFWLGLVAYLGTPDRTGLGHDLFRPGPVLNLLLWPISLPAWLVKMALQLPTRYKVALALLWLPVAYAGSIGPAEYAAGRGWLPSAILEAAYTPLWACVEDSRLEGPLARYEAHYAKLGLYHRLGR